MTTALIVLFGAWCTKFLVLNLLPLPPYYVGQAALQLLRRDPERPRPLLDLGLTLAGCAVGFAWLGALGSALRAP